MYANGRGIPHNDTEAVRWYRMAAEQGHAKAQLNTQIELRLGMPLLNLGVMYANGRGIPQNDIEAVRWFRMAAEQGFAEAAEQIHMAAEQGIAEAVQWVRESAEQGNVKAQLNLGYLYITGRGVPKDYVQAYAWSSIAAAQGDEMAKLNLGHITKEMTTADITKAQELSREYWEAYGPNRASSE